MSDHHPHRPALPPQVARTMRRMILDTRRQHGRPQLTDVEEMVLDVMRDHQEAEDSTRTRSVKRLPSRMQRAVDRWSIAASQVAVGLTNATVGEPPQRPERSGVTNQGVSDPTSTVVSTTIEHIERAAEKYVHLTTPCALDGDHDRWDGRCPGPHAVDLGDHADVHLDADDLADNVLGSTCQTRGWNDAVHALATWHTMNAARIGEAFRIAYRGGASEAIAETSALEAWVTDVEDLVRRLDRLAGSLAQWSGREERRCKTGCGAAVDSDPLVKPRGGAMCGRCAGQQSRRKAS